MTLTDESWKRGIPLLGADWRFAPAHLRQEYKVAADNATKPTPKFPSDPTSSEAWEVLQQSVKSLTATSEVRSKMTNQLFAWLASGQLVAYGFSMPRRPDDTPVEVPKDLFERRFLSFKHAGLSGNGLEFTAVRVFHPTWIESAPKESPKQAGRKSAKDQIGAAIRLLLARGEIDAGVAHKVNIGLVREFIHQHAAGEFIGDKGLSDETIRRVLVEELRKAAKRA